MNRLSHLALAALPALAALAAPAAQAGPIRVDVTVDTRVCATGAVQCSGAGHTFDPAGALNHNPIALRVLVVNKNGLPVNGLTAANFMFADPFVPAGGGSAVLCSVAECGASTFLAAGPGLYQLFLDRGPAGNWTPGGYFGAVQVNAGVNDGEALVAWVIPS
jgi:hypothetical protein